MFKKIIVGMMVVCSVFALVGCGTQEVQEQEQTVSVQESYVPTSYMDFVNEVFRDHDIHLDDKTNFGEVACLTNNKGVYMAQDTFAVMVGVSENDGEELYKENLMIAKELVDTICGDGEFMDGLDEMFTTGQDVKRVFDDRYYSIVYCGDTTYFIVYGDF